MIRELELKPDFAKTIERFAAWWEGRGVDRPPVTLRIDPRGQPARGAARDASSEDTGLEPEVAVERAVAEILGGDYPGDSFPALVPRVDAAVTAALYGAELQRDASPPAPIVSEPEDWQRVLATAPDFGGRPWRNVEALTDLAIERSSGRFVVGLPSLYGNYDALAALRGSEPLCLDLIDHPELLRQVGAHVADGIAAGVRRLHEKLARAGFGSTTWLPFYHEGPAYVVGCDFWGLVSETVARDLVVPDIVRELRPLERSIFHLDGPDALRHLDLLLELPQLRAVQWAYGASRGPALRWAETYERVLASGRAVQVMARDAQDALAVLERLGAPGVWLCVEEPFASADEAQRFLREVERSARA
jgi:hypothetical protein